MTASPVARHQLILGNLHFFIKGFLRRKDLGEVFLSPFDVVFSNFDVVEPDLLYISRERWSLLTEANLQGSPDLVVEILSPSTRGRDRGIKKNLYERFEVSEYWIVDPVSDLIEVLRRQPGGGLALVATLSRAAGDTLSTPLLSALEIPLEEIFPS